MSIRKYASEDWVQEQLKKSGGVTSWNDLEDRPFGESEFIGTITNETTLYEGRTYTFYNYNNGTYGGTVDGCYNSPNLNNPEYFYRVIWDGAEYICAPFEGTMHGSTRMCIGSPYEEVLAGTSVYPFIMSSSHAGVISVITNETKDSHAIDIYQLEGELIQPSGAIKPIETKYLPEHLRFGVTHEETVRIDYEEEWLSETTCNFQSVDGYYVSTIENSNTGYFIANRFYKIKWDGVTYYCWADDDTDLNGNSCFHIGSPLADIVSGGYVSIPFTMHTDGVNITIYTNETDSYHTIQMNSCEGYYEPERVAKINPKYLPEINFDMSAAVDEAKSYADTAATTAANKVKDDLLNGAGEAFDTLKELGDLIDDNQDALGALEQVATGKADKEHTHSWNDLEDKPFYAETSEVPIVLEWDGDLTDRVSFRSGQTYGTCLMSDKVFNENDYTKFIGKTAKVYDGEKIVTITIDESMYKPSNPYNDIVAWVFDFYGHEGITRDWARIEFCTAVNDKNNWISDDIIPGIYFSFCDESGTYVASLELDETTTVEKVETLDIKYLPESVLAKPDWNQNDETALDYVKNRPFYGVLEDTIILEETTIEPDENGWVETYLPLIPLEEIKVYTVTVDGEVYECVPFYDQENDEYIIETDLFYVSSSPSYDETYISYNGDGVHTISISTKTGEVTKLDRMYLPNSIFVKPDWNENDHLADGFIKNRPFARYLEGGYYILEDFTFEGTEYEGEYTSTVLNRFVEGQSYDVYFDGILYEGVVYDDGLYYEDDDVYFEIYSEYWTDLDYVVDRISIHTNVEGSHSISIEGPAYYYRQLDDQYLPASIIADWNETSAKKKSYIKNKPFGALKVDEVLFEGEITPEDINVDSEINITFDNAVEYNLNLSGVSSDVLDNLMSNQLTYTVTLNGVEYRNLVPTFFYNTEWNREAFAGGIGASMTLSDDDHVVTVNFTEEYPFSVKFSDLDGMYHLLLPKEFEGQVSNLKISVFGNVVNKLEDMYQHQADWNELVDTKASFIANKPFGEYLDYKLVPMYEGVSIIEDAGLREDGSSSGQFIDYPYETEDPNYNPVELNKKYTVIINNVRYDNLECFEVYNGENTSGIPTVGSPRYMLGTSAAEYPFTIDAAGFGGIWLYIDTNKLPITEDSKFYLYEYAAETKVKTLDVKYLPEQFQFGKIQERQYTTILEEDFTPSNGSYGFQQGTGILEEGELYRITLKIEELQDDNEYTVEETAVIENSLIVVWINENAALIYSSEYNQIAFSGNPNAFTGDIEYHIVVERVNEVEVLKTIDPKYLPELGDTHTHSWNDLQDRPFGEIVEKTYEDTFDIEYTAAPDNGHGFTFYDSNDYMALFESGVLYRIDINGNIYESVSFEPNNYTFAISDYANFYISSANYSAYGIGLSIQLSSAAYPEGTQIHIKIQKVNVTEEVKTIDPKYLPEHLQFGETESVIDVTSEVELLRNGEYGYFVPVDNYYTYTIMGYLTEANMGTFESDKFYKVVWDGVDYYCPVFEEDKNALGAGDFKPTIGSSWADIKAGTATYPFSIYYTSNTSIQIYTNSSEQLHTMAIYVCEGTCIPGGITKIDPKFLPEMNFDMSEAVDKAKAYTDEVATNKSDKGHTHSWNDLEDKPVYTTDEEFMDMLMSIDALNVVADADNLIITDESDNVLIW